MTVGYDTFSRLNYIQNCGQTVADREMIAIRAQFSAGCRILSQAMEFALFRPISIFP